MGQLVAQRLAEDALGCAETVGLGCVEEVHTQFVGAANRRDGRILVELTPVTPELPGAEGDSRYVEAASAQCRRLHVVPIPSGLGRHVSAWLHSRVAHERSGVATPDTN